MKWYRAAFEDNSTDELVIDSLITLSLMNKRKVSKEVLNAAIKTDTSRLHMLAAACYLNEGDISRAKSENIRAILMSGESYNPAFGQYIAISTSIHSNEVITITGIEADTAACCKKIMVVNVGYVYIRIVFSQHLHMFGIMIIICILMMLLG